MKMDDNFLRYSALDSACTLEAHNAFWADLDPIFSPAYHMTINILPVLTFMQSRGIVVDKVALEETKVDVLRAAKEKQEELDKLCGQSLNVNSTKQCQDYFYAQLGITPYRNKEGKPTLDDLALQRLVRGTAARPGLRQAKLVQDIRGLQKLYGTYLNLEFDRDGRMRGSYNPRGTKFGRLSSSKTIFGTGTNFQNLPQEFKKFLVADPGYVFIEVDKRQAEWVAVAYLTGDANMISAVESGTDVHTHTACEMFNVTPEIVKLEAKLVGHSTDADYISEVRHSNLELVAAMRDCGKTWPRTMTLRQCGKKSNHGLNYDEGPNGFALINEIEIKEAKDIVKFYHEIYPGIRIWYESIKRQLQKDRTLTNHFGRAVRFLDAWGDKLWKSAYSMLPQSTIVDSLNGGMAKIYAEPWVCGKDGMNGDVLAQVHDSVLMQFPIINLESPNKYNRLLDFVSDVTSPDITYSARTFKIASDYKFGINWGEYHSERNPGGMRDIHTHEEFLAAVSDWEKIRGERAVGLA
jgi:DNA polymerase-1